MDKPTMAQAKERWNKHTRHVLTDATKKCLRGATWGTDFDGCPCLVSKDTDIVLHFRFDKSGNVYAAF